MWTLMEAFRGFDCLKEEMTLDIVEWRKKIRAPTILT